MNECFLKGRDLKVIFTHSLEAQLVITDQAWQTMQEKVLHFHQLLVFYHVARLPWDPSETNMAILSRE
jgi:hypothetical protein